MPPGLSQLHLSQYADRAARARCLQRRAPAPASRPALLGRQWGGVPRQVVGLGRPLAAQCSRRGWRAAAPGLSRLVDAIPNKHKEHLLRVADGARRCFETRADKYTYSICVFGDAAQKDGSAHTRLGSWKGFADNYSTMRFEGGQGCWQGPARSLQVHPPPRSSSIGQATR